MKAVLDFFTQKEQLDADAPPQYLSLNQYAVNPYQMNILYPLIAKLSKTLTPQALNTTGLSPDIRRRYSGFAPGDINALLQSPYCKTCWEYCDNFRESTCLLCKNVL